jgi:hypothetical protein
MTPKQKEEGEAKKLIKFENVTVEDVCNGYYAGAQWECKEEEERTKEAFNCAYNLALKHFGDTIMDYSKITRLEIINHAKNDRQIGRLLSLHKSLGDFNALEPHLQDGGETLKIFLD